MKRNNVAPVSVIIPCYLCANTIKRAVESVWKQTLKPFEVILIDDCSPDSGQTLKKLYEIQQEYSDSWVKVISLPVNKGPGNARNIGWDNATQPYIAFLDADDTWHPRKIEIQYGWMKDHPNVSLTGHSFKWIKGSNPSFFSIKGPYQIYQVKPIELLLSNKFSTPSVMIKRDIPYRFDSNKKYSEDYLLWLEILLNNNEAWRINLPLVSLHKAPFGEGGLSGQLWKMEIGELDTYYKLNRLGLINKISMICLAAYSLFKFSYRLMLNTIYKFI
jgi:glycosyltransferase involved in cell wall biosynthesis